MKKKKPSSDIWGSILGVTLVSLVFGGYLFFFGGDFLNQSVDLIRNRLTEKYIPVIQLGADPRTLRVTQGGTGAASFSPDSIIVSGTTSTASLVASSSPVMGFITATSTATSTFAGGIRLNAFNCATQGSGGALTVDANGMVVCSADDTGSVAVGSASSTVFTTDAVTNFFSNDLSLNGIKITGTATSSWTPGIAALSFSATNGLTLTGGQILSTGTATSSLTGGLEVGGLTVTAGSITSQGTATSTYTGGISSAGLSSSSGLVITGGRLENTASATSSFTGGLLTGGLTVTAGSITSQGTATSTFSGGIASAGLSSSSGLIISGGRLENTVNATSSFTGGLLTGGLTVTAGSITSEGTATSTFSGGIASVGLSTSKGLIISAGRLENTSSATSSFTGGLTVLGEPLSMNFEKSFWVASTTIDKSYLQYKSATTTFEMWNPAQAVTLVSIFCKTDTGNVVIRAGDGTNWTESLLCSSTGGEKVVTSNNTFTTREDVRFEIGTQTTASNKVTITARFNYD